MNEVPALWSRGLGRTALNSCYRMGLWFDSRWGRNFRPRVFFDAKGIWKQDPDANIRPQKDNDGRGGVQEAS